MLETNILIRGSDMRRLIGVLIAVLGLGLAYGVSSDEVAISTADKYGLAWVVIDKQVYLCNYSVVTDYSSLLEEAGDRVDYPDPIKHCLDMYKTSSGALDMCLESIEKEPGNGLPKLLVPQCFPAIMHKG